MTPAAFGLERTVLPSRSTAPGIPTTVASRLPQGDNSVGIQTSGPNQYNRPGRKKMRAPAAGVAARLSHSDEVSPCSPIRLGRIYSQPFGSWLESLTMACQESSD